MAGGGQRIQRLSRATVDVLQAGKTVVDLAQCVEELVLNAVDAGATRIDVAVNVKQAQVIVRDNGRGISLADLDLLAEPHCTSKLSSFDDLTGIQTYGFRGEALAALAAVSLLTIETRQATEPATLCKIVRGGEVVVKGRAGTELREAGTCVTVTDLFYNLPVRRKRITAGAMDRVKHKMSALALMQPKLSLSLTDSATGYRLLNSGGSVTTRGVFARLFGTDKSRHLISLNHIDAARVVEGYVSTDVYYTHDLQFIFVNKRPVRRCFLHHVVVSQLLTSIILAEDPSTMKQDNPFKRKKRNRHAIFVLNIVLPSEQVDVTHEPTKSLVSFEDEHAVRELLKRALRQFLAKHDLLTDPTPYQMTLPELATRGAAGSHSRPAPPPASSSSTAAKASASALSHFQRVVGDRHNSKGHAPITSHAQKEPEPSTSFSFPSSTPSASTHLPQRACMTPSRLTPRRISATSSSTAPSACVPCISSATSERDSVAGVTNNNQRESAIAQSIIGNTGREHNGTGAHYSDDGGSASGENDVYGGHQQLTLPLVRHRTGDDARVSSRAADRASVCDDHGKSKPSEDHTPSSTRDGRQLDGQSGDEGELRRLSCSSRDRGSEDVGATASMRFGATPTGSGTGASKLRRFVQRHASASTPRNGILSHVAEKMAAQRQPAGSRQGRGLCGTIAAGGNGDKGEGNNGQYQRHNDGQENGMVDDVGDTGEGHSAEGACDDDACASLGPRPRARAVRVQLSRMQPTPSEETPQRQIRHEARGRVKQLQHPNHESAIVARETDRHSPTTTATNDSAAADVNKWKTEALRRLDLATSEEYQDPVSSLRATRERRGLSTTQSQRFDGSAFEDFEVLGQADCKFIACLFRQPRDTAGPVIVLIDQHAAHERIRLERLEREHFQLGASVCATRVCELLHPWDMQLAESDAAAAEAFTPGLKAWGIHLTRTGAGAVSVTHLPAALVEETPAAADRNSRGSSTRRQRLLVNRSTVEELIEDEITHLRETQGRKRWNIPPTLQDVLNTRACHGAIRFGDKLTLQQCRDILHNLAKCKLPFQCAHGRPSLAPLVNIASALHVQQDMRSRIWDDLGPKLRLLAAHALPQQHPQHQEEADEDEEDEAEEEGEEQG